MWPLDARELAAWWEKYDKAKLAYVRGRMSRIEAIDALRNLRYRDQALSAEINVWGADKREFARLTNVDKYRSTTEEMFRIARLREMDDDARTVAASSAE